MTTNQRNTAKEKRKRNKSFPYKKLTLLGTNPTIYQQFQELKKISHHNQDMDELEQSEQEEQV